MTLIEAIQSIDVQLVPGRVYNFEAEGCQVELRVRTAPRPPAKPLDLESDTMLDAWVEFPCHPDKILPSRRVDNPSWPDPPIIPEDDE